MFTSSAAYNERLFSSGIRRYLHLARFFWLARQLRSLDCQYDSVVELGCFDGKVLDFLPIEPHHYAGFDANWEGGLELARERWHAFPDFVFQECHAPDEMTLQKEAFDLAICMDTLEHIPPNLVGPYLERLTHAMRHYVLVTVPNEKGLMFLSKFLLKRIIVGETQPYTLAEVLAATLGRMEQVERNEHKGFDYAWIIRSLSQYCHITHVSGYPFPWLPLALNFGVGIIGQKRPEE